jgi:hypothetical protein
MTINVSVDLGDVADYYGDSLKEVIREEVTGAFVREIRKQLKQKESEIEDKVRQALSSVKVEVS